jgi:hypothetical protein
MNDAPQPTADYYRERAQEIRRFAWRARSADIRLELFDLAKRFDRMAAHVERRMRSGEGVGRNLEHTTVSEPSPLRPMPIKMGGHP